MTSSNLKALFCFYPKDMQEAHIVHAMMMHIYGFCAVDVNLQPEEHHGIAWLNSLEFVEFGAQHCSYLCATTKDSVYTVFSEIYTKRSTLNCFLCQPVLNYYPADFVNYIGMLFS
ncbi:hypothetical protein T4A_12286 [Trichinella pseudospiralis]|uniref:Uncharacterized protein n=1 Tax=Trichinella pseudospiralis TaxID=6337 RepID=A0A0V1EJG6_TRIPS|nr:hypothetical protein T4A_12286 [Trichinella pseudospiralis]